MLALSFERCLGRGGRTWSRVSLLPLWGGDSTWLGATGVTEQNLSICQPGLEEDPRFTLRELSQCAMTTPQINSSRNATGMIFDKALESERLTRTVLTELRDAGSARPWSPPFLLSLLGPYTGQLSLQLFCKLRFMSQESSAQTYSASWSGCYRNRASFQKERKRRAARSGRIDWNENFEKKVPRTCYRRPYFVAKWNTVCQEVDADPGLRQPCKTRRDFLIDQSMAD